MVIVKLRKMTLVWDENEFISFLQRNPDFLERGIKNGKYHIRREKEEKREERQFERFYRGGG